MCSNQTMGTIFTVREQSRIKPTDTAAKTLFKTQGVQVRNPTGFKDVLSIQCPAKGSLDIYILFTTFLSTLC